MFRFLDVAAPDPVTPISTDSPVTLIVIIVSIIIVGICIGLIVYKNKKKK